jgi:hypothetical protein
MNRFPTRLHVLNFQELGNKGRTVFKTHSAKLVFTLRGGYMIDVFDLDTLAHVAYLDFDITRKIILGHAFGSPVIGLPFSNPFRKTFGEEILPFKDLRSHHDVGLFVEKAYRNKGVKRFWNLDVILMTIAMETAFEKGVEVFTIKPTGDRARYYRSKFYARICPTTDSDVILGIDLKSVRNKLKCIELQEAGGKTVFLKVKGRFV